jgi:hypothetical protein
MTSDNVIISKEELTRKEMILKDRLYNNYPCQLSTQTQKMLKGKSKDVTEMGKDEEVYNPRPVMKFPVPDKPTSGEVLYRHMQPRDVATNAKKKMQEGSTDKKMHAFLDEMRQQFLQTQNANVVPQSLMYRQTQLMESQVRMLE